MITNNFSVYPIIISHQIMHLLHIRACPTLYLRSNSSAIPLISTPSPFPHPTAALTFYVQLTFSGIYLAIHRRQETFMTSITPLKVI